MQKQTFLGMAAALASLATSALAEGVVTMTPDLETSAGAYLQAPPMVPRDGCVWNNTVFSNGAIIERHQMPWAFFRCIQGTWRSFDSFHDATVGREVVRAGSAMRHHSSP
jgi:hypothetical protein